MRWRRFGWALLLIVFLAGGGCSPSPEAPIIIFCSPDSLRMRQAISGLEATLGQGPLNVVCVPEFGDQAQEVLRRLRKARPRLLITLGTAALLRVAPVEKSLPVVFALVANPFFTGAAYDPEHLEVHQENITGIFSPPPLTPTLKLGRALLGPKTWGLLADPNDGTAVELAARFAKEAPTFGIEPLMEESADAADDLPKLRALVARGARVIYLPPTLSAQRYAETLLAWGRELKVLVVSGHPEIPPKGAVLWVALDYRRLGEEAGALARRVLQGEKPAGIPIKGKTPLKVEVDEKLLGRWSNYPPSDKAPGRKGEEGQRGKGQSLK